MAILTQEVSSSDSTHATLRVSDREDAKSPS